jgi:arabinofuranosyltransferase
LPVEGYTSLSWVLILDLCWRVTGVEPPVASGWLSLACGYTTLYLTYRMLARLRLPAALETHRVLLASLCLLGIATNRTFLAWLSSGLETSLFNLLVIWWTYSALTPREDCGRCFVWHLSIATALMALTRPDGLLFLVATLALLVDLARTAERRRDLVGAAPLGLVAIHIAFRRLVYGSFLPNTYYAKQVAAWPEAGMRYLGSFVLEYGLWLWIVLLAVGLFSRAPGSWPRLRSSTWIVVATLALHVGYYTFLIGGDHFEYRVLSHLVPLVWVAALPVVAGLTARQGIARLLLASLLAVSWPIPWVHWMLSQDRVTRLDTFKMIQPVAEQFPAVVRPVVRLWDGWQAWLIERLVCARHQEHKIFQQYQAQQLPDRTEGTRVSWDERPVYSMKSVGMGGWVLPNVAIIDRFGLNDRVIARTPPDPSVQRLMAHERRPPAGYVECFRPNVTVRSGNLHIEKRDEPLTDSDIERCERTAW